ncbi:MAG TPA: hypothetical protein EYN92_04845 [Dehalococcoidia bacterium]|nr:hypothetical protein [Dehalococcoidia bacterium]
MNKDGFRRTRRVRSYPAHTIKDTLEIAKAIYHDNAGLPLDRKLLATHLGISPRSSSFTTLLAASEQYGFTRGRYRDDTISLTDLGISISMPKSIQELTGSLLKAAHMPEKFGKLNQLINEGELPKPEFLTNLLVRDLGIAIDQTDEFTRIFTENLSYIEGIGREGNGPKILPPPLPDKAVQNIVENKPVSIDSVMKRPPSPVGKEGYLLFIDTTETAKNITSAVISQFRTLGIPTKSIGPYDDLDEPEKAVATVLVLNASGFNEEIQFTEIFAVGVANGITPGNVILVSESIEFQKYFPASGLKQGHLLTYQDVNSLVMGLLTHLTAKGCLSMKTSIP